MGELRTQIDAVMARIRSITESPEYLENQARNRREDAEERARSLEAARNARRLSIGIPLLVWPDLDSPTETEALAAARSFIDAPASCVFLVLSGVAGVGKTRAACWLLDKVTEPVDQGPSLPALCRCGKYALAHDLVMAGTFGEMAAHLWRDLDAADVIVIDELGPEHRNAAYEATLYSLLNKRHANGLKTVICTNLDASQFAQRYCPTPTDPLRDRLKTGGRWVNLQGKSLRQHWTERNEENEP